MGRNSPGSLPDRDRQERLAEFSLSSHISDLVCHEARLFEFEPQQILKAKTCPKTRKRKDVPALRIQTLAQKTKALPKRPSPRRLEVPHIVVWKMVSPPGI